jgi:hypothetical protein
MIELRPQQPYGKSTWTFFDIDGNKTEAEKKLKLV